MLFLALIAIERSRTTLITTAQFFVIGIIFNIDNYGETKPEKKQSRRKSDNITGSKREKSNILLLSFNYGNCDQEKRKDVNKSKIDDFSGSKRKKSKNFYFAIQKR